MLSDLLCLESVGLGGGKGRKLKTGVQSGKTEGDQMMKNGTGHQTGCAFKPPRSEICFLGRDEP